MKVTFGFRVAVLRSCSPRENVFDALGRKVELNESDAAIEGFAVMRDQPIPKARDPEMHQTKKGNQWYFGMRAHFGVDSRTKLIHAGPKRTSV